MSAKSAIASSILSADGRSLEAICVEAIADEGEHLAEQGAVERALALEVVVDHRLVDAGAAGDAIDAGAAEPALGELEGGGGEDAVGGDAGRPCHN